VFQGNSRLPLRALLADILATLKETGWFVSGPNGAATRPGMNRSALQFRMKKLGIVQPGLREAKPPQLTAFDLGF
jgi:hypothetical protein